MIDRTVIPSSVGRVDGDNVIFTQSWWNQIPILFIFAALELTAIAVTLKFPESTSLKVPMGAAYVSISYLPPLPLFVFGKAAFRVLNERLVVTPSYMIHVTGRLSWQERSVRLEYPHIQEIETVQTIFQRMFGLGDLIITPIGGAAKNGICMEGLANPRAVKDLIRNVKNRPEQGTSTSCPEAFQGPDEG